MDVRKLRGAFLRVRYSILRLIAAIEDVLETYQTVGLIRRLTDAGAHLALPAQLVASQHLRFAALVEGLQALCVRVVQCKPLA